MLSRQEIFDKAVSGVLGQGDICMNERGDCVYANKGSHCAIGWLVPNNVAERWDSYNKGGWSISALFKDQAYLSPDDRSSIFQDLAEAGIDTEDNKDFLVDLQGVHDGSDRFWVVDKDGLSTTVRDTRPRIEQFRANAIDFAKRWGLATAILD